MSAQATNRREQSEWEPVTTAQFCQGMRNLAGACVVITGSDAGQRAGLTATAVCSISADPPRLLVCVNRNVYAHRLISNSGVLCINALQVDQEHIARRFAGMVEGVAGEERFAAGAWDEGANGLPTLADALVAFECRVVETIAASSHDMFIAEVIGVTGTLSQEDPLIYFNGKFSALAQVPGIALNHSQEQ